jgi:hypothetical protein
MDSGHSTHGQCTRDPITRGACEKGGINASASLPRRSCVNGLRGVKARFHYSDFLETNSRLLEEVADLSESEFHYSRLPRVKLKTNSRKTRDVADKLDMPPRRLEFVEDKLETSGAYREFVADLSATLFVATVG